MAVTITRASVEAPLLDIDPFSTDFLSDPHPFHEEMRDAGPVVRLSRYGVWAMARHAQVQPALADWRVFSSARGVGIDDFARNRPWRPPSLLLEIDPPLHDRTRTVMNRVLGRRPAENARRFRRESRRARRRTGRAASFRRDPRSGGGLSAACVPGPVGLRPDGRENLLPYGGMVFNSFGPATRCSSSRSGIASRSSTGFSRNAAAKRSLPAASAKRSGQRTTPARSAPTKRRCSFAPC